MFTVREPSHEVPKEPLFFGHPIHPMLIPFPIAFFVATFVCDMVFWQTGNPLWATAAAVYDETSISRLIRG